MKFQRWFVALVVAIAAAGCLSTGKRPAPQPVPPVLIEGRDAEFTATCKDVFVVQLHRSSDQPWGPGDTGLEACLDMARRGATKEDLIAWLQASDEYKKLQADLAEAARQAEEERKREEEEIERNKPRMRGRLKADGLKIVDASGVEFIPAGGSALTGVVSDPVELAKLRAQYSKAGVNFLRMFAGRLTWAGQSVQDVYRLLPGVLTAARDDGYYVLVTAVTDSRDGGYDVEAHLAEIRRITEPFDNVILEAGNELYHGTQSDVVNDVDGFCKIARRVLAGYPNLWALGAAWQSEPVGGKYEADCGTINTAHLPRSRDQERMLAALNGIAEIARVTGKPVLNSEPIGAAEADRPGSRLSNPKFFGDMAHRGRSLGFGSLYHSEDGLHARPLGPVQLAGLMAFMEGMRKPTIYVPPQNPCVGARSQRDVVECMREKFPAGHLNPDQLEAIMRGIAKTLNVLEIDGGGFGVLIKTSGNNCNGISCDIICRGNGNDQRQWDVLRDEQDPVWNQVDPNGQVVRSCQVIPR